MNDYPCDLDNASASLARLTKCVSAAARETLPIKRPKPLRKRKVSQRTKIWFEERRRNFNKLSEQERRESTRIFRRYYHLNPGMTVGTGGHNVRMAKFEYADDAALIDEDAGQATARVTWLAAGSIADAAMIISTKKSKVMHNHKTTRTSATTEADVAKLNLVHPCESSTREFTKLRGQKKHMARWSVGGHTQRSCVGYLTNRAVKSSKRRAAEASLDQVAIDSDPPLENVPHFQYLGSRLQGDGSDEADVGHRLEIAVGVQLFEPPVGRPLTITQNKTSAVPSLYVLVPHTLLQGLNPQSNGDLIDKRVQQQVSARNDGRCVHAACATLGMCYACLPTGWCDAHSWH